MIKKYTLLCICSAILVVILIFCGYSHERHTESSLENWEKARTDERLDIVQDLIDREILIGKTKEELFSVLGKKGLLAETHNTVEYAVGNDSLWEPISLYVELNNEGYVINATIYWR